MPEYALMEPERPCQTTLLGIFSPSDLTLTADQIVDSAPTIVTTPVRLVYVRTERSPPTAAATSESEDEEDESQFKRRYRNPDAWRQNMRKRQKNLGLEYTKSNGQLSARKEIGPPCSCKNKCYQRIGEEACNKIFNNFWKLGEYSLQNAYIAGCVRIFLPKFCTKKNNQDAPRRRFYSRNFYVNVNGVDTEVCKQAFLNLHTISNGRLDRLLKKKQEMGNTGVDARGRHNNKVNKIPPEKLRDVRRFIDKIRKNMGFTGKRKSRNNEVLPAHYNIRYLYKLYRESSSNLGKEPVCEFRFRKIFHADFRIEFARPNTAQAQMAKSEPITPKPLSPAEQPLQIIEEKPQPIYTTLETKDDNLTAQETYHLAFCPSAQEIYSPYPGHQPAWLFSTQS